VAGGPLDLVPGQSLKVPRLLVKRVEERGRDHRQATGLEDPSQLRESAFGIGDMLEDLGAHHDVCGTGSKRERVGNAAKGDRARSVLLDVGPEIACPERLDQRSPRLFAAPDIGNEGAGAHVRV
jgi:hypothetical protein